MSDIGDEQPTASSITARARFLGADRRMNALWERLAMVARTKLPILILGETGSGKEVAAEWVFSSSARGQRLLKISCASLSESVVESELFGHVRGAFTGAHAAHAGIFEAADGGTLFLDEIGELPLSTQAKLLRVIESGEVVRLGSTQPRRIDVRIVSATHRDLAERTASGLFREDLYFRLNGLSVRLPPLRERRSEVLPLARMFAERCARRNDLPVPAIGSHVEDALLAYDWPGNVRELRHVIERGVALCQDGGLCVEHLELTPHSSASSWVLPAPAAPTSAIRTEWQRFERAQIIEALEQAAGNQTRAAQRLGISRRTLTNKLNMYGLPRPRKSSS